MPQNSKTSKPVLDKYKDALQPMVDEALAVQTLAPAIQESITQSRPLHDTLQELFIESIKSNARARKAVAEAAKENNIIEKSKADYKQPGFWIPILISTLVGISGIIVAIFSASK